MLSEYKFEKVSFLILFFLYLIPQCVYPSALLEQPPVSWNLPHALEAVQGDTANLLAMACVDVPSRRSSVYRLMPPVVTLT